MPPTIPLTDENHTMEHPNLQVLSLILWIMDLRYYVLRKFVEF